ncbi:MAG TPA: adenylyl-sulfate kinase [Bryobacteraceae bacterium]|nr:adenylyl-sulfate kinase [Bryobacteraceae bacterium]
MAEPELLRFLTAGSVDDGKSTLMGRLLHDLNAIYQDQLASVRAASPVGSPKGIDFSLVTDGLKAEREQGITIDVAYRYFATPRRRFIVADTPGHEQYTRNMATGASTAGAAVLLVDARKGALSQTYRHAVIAWLLGIRHFAVAVNKMDLVEFREDEFRAIERGFGEFAAKLAGSAVQFIPTCAPDGDNVTRRSSRTPWFRGPSLLEYLETVPVRPASGDQALRLPVQTVLRPSDGSRWYAGEIASGSLRRGDSVTILPSRQAARIIGLRAAGDEVESAVAPLSVSVAFEKEMDIGRGDMLADPGRPPVSTGRIAATVLWMGDDPLEINRPYLLKHTSRYVCASVVRLDAVLDPQTLTRNAADRLAMNEFGEVEIECHHPLYCDPYSENRATGAFILVDPMRNGTLAAGMIRGRDAASSAYKPAGHGLTVWFTGLSSAGKTTISRAVHEKLWAMGYKVELLDGDIVRQHLSKDLGFSKEDRDENVRRIGFVAETLTRNGVIVLVSAISPYRAVRDEIRGRIGSFLEVFVNAPLEVCEQRDLKGIYRRARSGELRMVTGVDDPYEAPAAPEVECHTGRETLGESTAKVLRAIEEWFGRSG